MKESILGVDLNISFWQAVKMLFKRKRFQVKIHWKTEGSIIIVESIEGKFI